jgi:divinyl protochlorophyllide a 8-vinyl-reductase
LPSVQTHPRLVAQGAHEESRPRIGPNAIIQTLAALEVLEGPGTRDRIARLAGVSGEETSGMVPETRFLSLLAALRRTLDDGAARRVLLLAGEKTGDYVAANRIPAAVRGLLHLLPPRTGIPMLLKAFQRNAWTFAGRSDFEVTGGFPGDLLLNDAPTCRLIGSARPTGGYYEAAFQRLLSLASPDVVVTETECRSSGASKCRFRVQLSPSRG